MKTKVLSLFDKVLTKFKIIHFRNIIKHSFWSVFGSALSKIIMLIASILLARILTQNDYGELGIVRSTINMFVVFAGFGIGNTTSRYISLFKSNNINEARRIFDISLAFTTFLALLLSGIIIVFAKQISFWSFNTIELYEELRISSVLLFFATINGAYAGSLAGFQDFKEIAKNSFFANLTQGGLAVLGGYFLGVEGVLIGYGLGYILLFLLHKKSIKKNFGKTKRKLSVFELFKSDLSFLWTFSLPSAFSSFLVIPAYWLVKSFMIRTSGFEEMANYDVAEQWRLIVLFVPSSLIPIILPALSSGEHDFKEVLKFNIKTNLIIVLITIIPLILLSKNIMQLYGQEYINVKLFIVLLISTIFSSYCNVVGSAIASLGIMWKGLFYNFLWTFYLIFFSYYFISNNMGALGLGYAILISYIIHGITQYFFLTSVLKNK